jgi:hypothetical protein
MSSLPKFSVTADNADQIEKEYRAKKKEAAKPPSDEPKKGPGRPPKEKLEMEVTKQDMRTMDKVISSKIKEKEEENKAANEEKRKKKIIDQAADNLIKVQDYKRHFPELFQDIELPRNPTPEDIYSALSRMRKTLDSFGAENMVKGVFPQIFRVAEELHHKFNPFNWDLNGLGATMSDPENLEALETELTEATIELKPWLAKGWEVRMAYKICYIMKTYSDERRKLHVQTEAPEPPTDAAADSAPAAQ